MSKSQTLHRVARALGWFSVALGTAELLRPRQTCTLVGAAHRPGVVRMAGARECITGVGLLMARNPAPWLWARVVGDVADMAALATDPRPHLRMRKVSRRSGVALGMLTGVLLVDLISARRVSQYHRQREVASRYDYSDRSGWPAAPEAMRGLASAL